jgi:DNA repair protein RecO (recombination protein O)
VVGQNTYKAEGIVLKRTNFGEADKILTLYTKDRGKIVCLAKGIRRMSSRKRGNLEIFNHISFFAAKGKGLDIVTETEILDSYLIWRNSLKKVATAYEICEILDKLTPENLEQEDVYDLLALYLHKIGQVPESELKSLVSRFGEMILKLLGYWPKDKAFPEGSNISNYIENIIERDLKSRRFLDKL